VIAAIKFDVPWPTTAISTAAGSSLAQNGAFSEKPDREAVDCDSRTVDGLPRLEIRGMHMSKIEEIASTVLLVLKPGMKAKELRKAVKSAHPKASSKEVARAAFFAMLTVAEKSPDTAQILHEAGMSLRVTDEEPSSPKKEKPVKAKEKRPKAKKTVTPEASKSKH
jgi:hypothetical protein